MRRWFQFPSPVNDAAARTVALGVVLLATVTFVTGAAWLLVPLAYGFVARVASGPTWSPLGQFAVRVVAPRLDRSPRWRHWTRFVPGPPKRFAQTMGVVFSGAALTVWLTVGWTAARWLLVPLLFAAGLEGFAGYCVGCAIFGWLMARGVVPASVCAECADITPRPPRPEATAAS